MTEQPTKSDLDKRVSRVNLRLLEDATEELIKAQGVVKMDEIKLTPDGLIEGEMPSDNLKYCRTSDVMVAETPKGKTAITLIIAGAGGGSLHAARVTALADFSSEEIVSRSSEIRDYLVSRVNGSLAEKFQVELRRDQSPSGRYYVCNVAKPDLNDLDH